MLKPSRQNWQRRSRTRLLREGTPNSQGAPISSYYNLAYLPNLVSQSRPELFLADSDSAYYTVENFHKMGSRVLSRSFIVTRWSSEDSEAEAPAAEADAADSGSMDVDDQKPSEADVGGSTDDNDGGDEDEDEDEADDPSAVAMVPMADMLNARYESVNVGVHGTRPLFLILTAIQQAKLFHEEHVLKMIATEDIKAGEQIVSRVRLFALMILMVLCLV